MQNNEYKQIFADLESAKYAPVYFLCGNEPYYIDKISDYIEKNALDEAEKAFNQVILYGKELHFKDVVDNARQYPMMASKRVVIVKEAQGLKDIEKLEQYISNPSPQTCLVLCYKYKKLDGRKSFAKTMKQKSVYFESKKLYDTQLAPWIQSHVRAANYQINERAAYLLGEYLGSDLTKIENELQKLMIDLPSGSLIDMNIIEDKIGISKEFNMFEFQKALSTRNVAKANLIANYFASNEKDHPIQMINGMLYSYFVKLWITAVNIHLSDLELSRKLKINKYFLPEYKSGAHKYTVLQLKKIFGFIKDADHKSKGVGNRSISNGDLLKEMVFNILHVN